MELKENFFEKCEVKSDLIEKYPDCMSRSNSVFFNKNFMENLQSYTKCVDEEKK